MSADSNAPSRYRLETLGTLALRGSVGEVNIFAQGHPRRRLALLAILAGSHKLGRSRDQLLLLLWPDSTEKKARHSLDQLLYGIRTSLGDSVFAGVNPLRLNPSVITADVADFERNLDDGDLVAVKKYRGPFLDGFFLSEAKEFEDWVEGERRRLAARYTDALEHLALDAERNGDFSTAIQWRQKLVDADPISTRHATAMARALAMAGDRAAALAFAERYQRTASRELGSDNVPDLRKIIGEVGDGSRTIPRSGQTLPANVLSPQSSSGTNASLSNAGIEPRRTMPMRTVALFTLVAAAALLLGIRAWGNFRGSSGNAPMSTSVAPATTQLRLSAARRETRSLEAYELYVRGQDPVLLRSDSAATIGLEYFTRAIELDPNFAAAHAGLAEMYGRQALATQPTLPHSELKKRAEDAARKAIALDDSLAEGHAALGYVSLQWLVDLTAAERELQRAISLDPAVPRARDYLAVTHALMGRTGDAVEDARIGVAANPLSPTARATLAQMLYIAGKCDEALPILDSVGRINPPPQRVAVARSLCFGAQNRWAEAVEAVRGQVADGNVHTMGMLGLALGKNGDRKDALDIRSKITRIARTNPSAYYEVALVSYGLGNIADALANFERAAINGCFVFEILGPPFASLHDNPRFKAIMDRRGIRLTSG